MFNFSRTKRPLLGIDIGSTTLKLVELSRITSAGANTYRVECAASEPMPPNAIVEKKVADPEAIGQCLRKLITRTGTKTKRAAVALAGSTIITKTIPMAADLKDADREAQIQLDVEQYIPYPLEEVNLDFTVLGPVPNNPEMVDVLLVASRRENVDDRVNILEIAGLNVVVVDVETYAIENACLELLGLLDSSANKNNQETTKPENTPTGSAEQTIAIADVGATTTNLHVIHRGQLLYTREQNFGGQQLRSEVQRRYGLTTEDATKQIIAGTVMDGYEAEVLGPFQDALAQQISRGLQFFHVTTNINKVDRVLLAGGAAGISKIDKFMEDRLQVPTILANPFARMNLAPQLKLKEKDLLREAPGMMIAVGLALRGFD